jgi:predicted  nucleic acid-binding Zn-ribbon protein
MKLSIINALGCAILLGLAATQWVKHENLRQQALQQQKETHKISVERDEAIDKISALQTDIADLKIAIEQTQQAAREATESAVKHEEEAKQLTIANLTLQTERDTITAERDALQARTTEWMAAIKERDEAITKLNENSLALRKRLDEAIAQLTKANAR